MDEQQETFTGLRRNRSTHWSITAKDAAARLLITIGGIGTIVAVCTVCLFLVAVVIPLFRSPTTAQLGIVDKPWQSEQAREPLHVAVDDYNLLAWAVFPDGKIRTFRLDNGQLLGVSDLTADGVRLTAWSFPQHGELAVLGYADGTVRLASIAFKLRFFDIEDAPADLQQLDVLEVAAYEQGLVQRTREHQLRHVTLEVSLQDPIDIGSDRPVVRLDHAGGEGRGERVGGQVTFVSMSDDGRIYLHRARSQRNMLTGQTTYRTTAGEIAYTHRQQPPRYVKLSGLGDNVFVIWADGYMQRFDSRNVRDIRLVQHADLSPAPGAQITAVSFLIGKTTLVVGDSSGQVTGWFRVRTSDVQDNPDLTVTMRAVALDSHGRNRGQVDDVPVASIQTPDQMALVPGWRVTGRQLAPVTSLSVSQRKRVLVAGHGDGRVRAHNATNQRLLFETRLNQPGPVEQLALSPRDDGLVAIGGQSIHLWSIDVPHPEVSLGAIFRPVWYEGYPEPQHVWQSTGGTDDFESKFGLMPLIFGTIKATLYSMIFAIPIALLAAIYTSEFLHPKLRSKVKPVIEMMASLPSVVLGFLAGLVIAQFVEDKVPAVLMAFVTIPMSFLIGAYVWQMLPRDWQASGRHLRLILILLMIPLGVWMAGQLGPVVERTFFAVTVLDSEAAKQIADQVGVADGHLDQRSHVVVHDMRTWLSAHRQDPSNPQFESSPVGGWMILFTPVSILLTMLLMTRWISPQLGRWGRGRGRWQLAVVDLVKFLAGAGGALGLAWGLSLVVGEMMGFDPRGSYIDQYVQRNAMVVGFIMGFAVIPIIYTIADDAMSAVPEHLRSASLGAGATPWQTAVRIVIPTAMSGLFSAIMIGFGRAVGETMIVLMAAGNTPIMEWNIFSGFRTLSANIAVEMMEAVKDSTNYRMLFLAALTLFTMTFCINTIAEVVRLKYRKRAFQL